MLQEQQNCTFVFHNFLSLWSRRLYGQPACTQQSWTVSCSGFLSHLAPDRTDTAVECTWSLMLLLQPVAASYGTGSEKTNCLATVSPEGATIWDGISGEEAFWRKSPSSLPAYGVQSVAQPLFTKQWCFNFIPLAVGATAIDLVTTLDVKVTCSKLCLLRVQLPKHSLLHHLLFTDLF